MFYTTPAAACKSSFEVVTPSTGTCPSDWHRWWQIEAANQNTDWKSLLAAADVALSQLRVVHGVSS